MVFRKIINNIRLILVISDFSLKRESKSKYLAIFEVYLRNLLMLLVLWAVFEFGLKIQLPNGQAYFPYFAVGYTVWSFFTETTQSMYGYLKSNRYMCEYKSINITILVFSNIYKNLIINILLMGSISLVMGVSLHKISIFDIIIGYLYTTAMILVLSYMILRLTIKYKKIEYYIPIFFNVLFWSVPIAWSENILDKDLLVLMANNPFYKLISIMRDGLGVNLVKDSQSDYINIAVIITIVYLFIFLLKKNNLNIIDGLKT